MIAHLMQTTAYVGLGSNLDDPAGQVRKALLALQDVPGCEVTATSGLYISPPMGPQDQPEYINAVAELGCHLTPVALLDALQAIETSQGRVRDGERWGPRTLDLDLLLFGTLKLFTQRLSLPHPGLTERAFVLYPLAEIAPDLEIPGYGTVRACMQQTDASGLRPMEGH